MNAPYASDRLDKTLQSHVTQADIDLVAACRTDATILFTGPSDLAEVIAREIHKSSGWAQGPFVVIDCAEHARDLDTFLTWMLPDADMAAGSRAAAGALPSQAGVVFLRAVDKLSPAAQAVVAEWLARVRPSGRLGPRRRVMASSREPLLSRIMEGTFDDRLYYRLSVIHIALDSTRES